MINNIYQNLANNENVITQEKNAFELFSNYNNLEYNDYPSDLIEPKIILSNEKLSKPDNINVEKIKQIIHNNELKHNIPNQKDHSKKNDKQNKNIDPEKYLSNHSIAQFYFASLTIVGLYVIFQMIHKSK